MAHGRIELTPEQQLAQLRLAYARYTDLAERWHEDGAADAGEREAREQDARRIAKAYEKTIANTTLRLESMHNTHVVGRGFTALAKGLSVMLAAAILSSGAAIAYLRPDIVQALLRAVSVEMPSPPPIIARLVTPAPTRAPEPAKATPVPVPRPVPVTRPAAKSSVTRPESRQASAQPFKAATPARLSPRADKAIAEAGRPRTDVSPEEAAETRALNQAYAVPPPLRDPFAGRAAPTAPVVLGSLPAPQLQQPAAETAVIPPTRLVPVMRTHLVPPYPTEAKKAGEQGTTQMQVSISTLGVITDCRVTTSSGSDRLDATACSFVQHYWRWLPPTRDGKEVPTTTKISVIWNLVGGR